VPVNCVRAALICQPNPLLGYKDALVPRCFSNNCLPFCPSLFTFLHPPLVPQASPAPLTPCQAPLVPTEPIRRGQWEKCRNTTADSHSLNASVALSRRPSDHCVGLWVMTPVERPALQQVAADLVTRQPQMQDHYFPPSSLVHLFITPPHTSTVAGQGRVSTLIGCVTAASPPRRPVADLHHGWFWSKEMLGPAQITLRPGQWRNTSS